MTFLRSICSTLGTEEYPLNKNIILLGRGADCDIRLDYGAVSRHHAKISLLADGFFLEDLQSSNGTQVNDASAVGSVRLYNGDRIAICDLEFVFVCDIPGSQRPAVRPRKRWANGILLDDTPPERPINVISQINLSDASGANRTVTLHPDDYEQHIQTLQTKLDVMLRLMKDLGTVFNQQELLPQFLENLLKLFPQADFSCYFAPDEATGQLELIDFQAKERFDEASLRISRSVLRQVFETRTAILSNDTQDDTRFDPTDSLLYSRICSMMVVPVIAPSVEEVAGVIQIDSRSSGRPFTNVDLDLLVSIASQIAVYQENLRYQEVRHNEEMMSQELSVAHTVQRSFLPYRRPEVSDYEFFDFYKPAQYLGGDYFDYIPLQDGRLGMVLADVAGKGISAALLMAKLSSEVRFSLLTESRLTDAMGRLNRVYCDPLLENRFVTVVMAVIDPTRHEMRLVNAGHVYPIRRFADGNIEEIGTGRQGFPIGVEATTQYEEILLTIEPGQSVFFMSDGIPDAMNADGDYFDLSRVFQVLSTPEALSPVEIGQRLIDEVHRFVGVTPQSDDQCLVILGQQLSRKKETAKRKVEVQNGENETEETDNR